MPVYHFVFINTYANTHLDLHNVYKKYAQYTIILRKQTFILDAITRLTALINIFTEYTCNQ